MSKRLPLVCAAAGITLLVVTAVLVFVPRGATPPWRLVLTLVAITNDAAGAKRVTLRLRNDGPQTARVLPVYGFEARPAKTDTNMMGIVAGGLRTLRPGEAWTNTIALPALDDHSWRVFFRYWRVRPVPEEFSLFWLRQVGLAAREEEGLVAYTDWVANEPD
jgi:hypothetical protein